ncbi:hypothetical protein EUTSA_v10029080mg [Eutrema salsugineum]|uniref:Uncharacterized protein n=1 Tax=Eutrema salsugineum TaxID=72664 RepID=V4MZ47_EUTSA|nr:hypothetical protein EUTSA_v10029080mg [Eutrema salsugineum]
MSILTDISSHNWLTIVVKPKNSSQAKRRMQIPSLVARTKRAFQTRNLTPITVVYRSPNTRPFEFLENASEQHVVSLLFHVDASRPIADVETITAKSAREELVALFSAQIPTS